MDDLDRLLSAYREALPDPEPSAGFTPGVWRRIESRRAPARLLRRLAEAFVTLAAVVTILLSTLLIPRLQNSPVYNATYLDVLDAAQTETQDYAELYRPVVVGSGVR